MGKFLKAVSFSYDDGVLQDKKLIELFDKYNLKGTFNLNSGLFGRHYQEERNGKIIYASKFKVEEIREIYKNHEVAVHTCTHPNLTKVTLEEAKMQIEQDKENLSKLVGYDVVGMAYPSGGVNFNDEITKLAADCGIKYARTTNCSYSFDFQENVMQYKPTSYHRYWEKTFELAEKFINLKPDKPQLFYVWGHAYEFDYEDGEWKNMEELCKMIANKEDIFYGTNADVFLKKWY